MNVEEEIKRLKRNYPNKHAATHAAGEYDAITPAAIGASADDHEHDADYVNVTGDTMTGELIGTTFRASTPYIARYVTSAGQSLPSGGSTHTVVDFGTSNYDLHSMVTTGASWGFTAPYSGYWQVSVMVMYANGQAWAAGDVTQLSLYRDGAIVTALDYREMHVAHSDFVALNGSTMIRVNAGQVLDARLMQNSGAAKTLHTTGTFNHISIVRV